MHPFSKHYSFCFNHFLLLLVIVVIIIFPKQVIIIVVGIFPQVEILPIEGAKHVEFLPGFEGPLPFHLETGYIGVGKYEEIQLFYYFVKSETNPYDHPLILWLSGEQGCSSLTGLVYEIGPLYFEAKVYNGNRPTLLLNEQSLTKNASIIFLDQPANSGFSYSTIKATYTDAQASNHVYQFLLKWFSENQDFVSNPFYIASGSYGGLIVPTILQLISDGYEAANTPINLKGYILGNPKTFPGENIFVIPFAYGMGLLSYELYQSLTENCEKEYVHVNSMNKLCSKNLHEFKKLTFGLSEQHILEPYCGPEEQLSGPRRALDAQFSPRRTLDEQLFMKSFDDKFLSPYGDDDHDRIWCRVDYHRLSNYWANDPTVQKALHVRKVYKEKWVRCKWNAVSKSYKATIHDTRQQHAILSTKGYRSLIYSGDHDMVVPFQSTNAWIKSLNSSIDFDWIPFVVNFQTAGYIRNYTNQMTFATIKGAGHIATESKPDECAALIARWISEKDITNWDPNSIDL